FRRRRHLLEERAQLGEGGGTLLRGGPGGGEVDAQIGVGPGSTQHRVVERALVAGSEGRWSLGDELGQAQRLPRRRAEQVQNLAHARGTRTRDTLVVGAQTQQHDVVRAVLVERVLGVEGEEDRSGVPLEL
ncbi:hypothetical protein ADL26_15135, partial [Thermoactinomyces vulgaris]